MRWLVDPQSRSWPRAAAAHRHTSDRPRRARRHTCRVTVARPTRASPCRVDRRHAVVLRVKLVAFERQSVLAQRQIPSLPGTVAYLALCQTRGYSSRRAGTPRPQRERCPAVVIQSLLFRSFCWWDFRTAVAGVPGKRVRSPFASVDFLVDFWPGWRPVSYYALRSALPG
jgi:hypothetical protein